MTAGREQQAATAAAGAAGVARPRRDHGTIEPTTRSLKACAARRGCRSEQAALGLFAGRSASFQPGVRLTSSVSASQAAFADQLQRPDRAIGAKQALCLDATHKRMRKVI